MQKPSYTHILTVAGAALLLFPFAASAQQLNRLDAPAPAAAAAAAQQNVPPKAQQTEDSVERAVKRFGIGVEAGVALDPELIYFGAHGTFGPIFHQGVQFRPGIEFGVGEVTTTFGSISTCCIRCRERRARRGGRGTLAPVPTSL